MLRHQAKLGLNPAQLVAGYEQIAQSRAPTSLGPDLQNLTIFRNIVVSSS